MSQLNRIEANLDRLAFNIDMNTIDISKYFPLKSNADLMEFLSDEEGTFEAKKKQFKYMLYTCVTNQKTQKRQFGEALKTTVFSRNYVTTHRWPTPK